MTKEYPSITASIRERVCITNYADLPLETTEEKVLCTLMVHLCGKDTPFTPKQFIGTYAYFSSGIQNGLSIDYNFFPKFKDEPIVDVVRLLKGNNYYFMKRDSYLQISRVIFGHNKNYEKELEIEFGKNSYSKSF